MHSVSDIDDSGFDLPIAAPWRSIIKGLLTVFAAPAFWKMAASIKDVVGGRQRQSRSALNYSALLLRVGNIGDAVFDRCQRRMLMMESVDTRISWETHTHLWPRPSGRMMHTPPLGIRPVLSLGRSLRSHVPSPGWMDGWMQVDGCRWMRLTWS